MDSEMGRETTKDKEGGAAAGSFSFFSEIYLLPL